MKQILLRAIIAMGISFLNGIILTCLFTGVLLANEGKAQNKNINEVNISLNLNQVSVQRALASIQENTDFKFIYEKDVITSTQNHKVTVRVSNESVASILKLIANETELSFRQMNRNIVVKAPPPPVEEIVPKKEVEVAPDRIITGRVTDDKGEPLPGANVLIKGTTSGVITDADGNYKIEVPDDATGLVFSYIGFLQKEVDINGRSIIDVGLMPDSTELDEVVVVGYGEQSKQKLTSSISKVTSKDIENLPVTSFDQALQGQAAGVHVSSASGTPGGAVLVRIRGQTSINAGSDPLYVVDGLPIISGSLTSDLTEGTTGAFNALSGINPGDIASIEVLKDAAATAIYGSRGANGVILITTKRGKKGKTNINLDVFGGVGRATELLDVLNTEEYLEIKREAYENDGLPIPDFLTNADAGINTDWQDEIYRTANISQYQLSAGGGNEKTTFYLSANYRNEETILLGSGLKRGAFRLNVDHQASSKFRVGAQIALSRERIDGFARGGSGSSPVLNAILAQPNIAVRDDSGEYLPSVILFGNIGINPVAELVERKIENTSSKVIAGLNLNYSILPGLDLRLDAGYDYSIFQQDVFSPSKTLIGFFLQGEGFFVLNQSGTYNVEPNLRFEKSFGDYHQINAVIGSTFMERNNLQSQIAGGNFVDDDLNFLISAGDIRQSPNTQTNGTDYSFTSHFARINYDYNNKYLLSGTIRRDGSSRFGRENRYGTFWAVSGGWIFTNEPFMESNQFLSFGKLRGSYGVIGNDQLGDFANLNKWSVTPGYGGSPGIRETQLGNPGLRWEQTAKLNLGLELGFWNGRISIETDYFLHRTKDLLLSKPLAGTAAFGTVIDNIGEVENKGFEISLNTINIQNEVFTWSSKLNITQVKNEIVSLVDDEPISAGTFNQYIVGEPINVLWGLDFLGVDPETGDAMYRDINNDGMISGNDDRIVIGNTLPDFYGGFTNSFSYKGLTLDVFLQFVNNVHLFDLQSWNNYFTGGVNRNNQIKEILNRWQNPGDVTNVPRVTTQSGVGLNNFPSQRYFSDASYLRLKNVTLSYNLPLTITEKLGIEKARLYFTGTNLLTFTDFIGQDPEVASPSGTASGVSITNLPQVKMFLAGINLTF